MKMQSKGNTMPRMQSILSRFSQVLRKQNVEQLDFFDARLQKLSVAKARNSKCARSVFKNRQSRLAV